MLLADVLICQTPNAQKESIHQTLPLPNFNPAKLSHHMVATHNTIVQNLTLVITLDRVDIFVLNLQCPDVICYSTQEL